jgi:hypothetical protein
VNREWIDKKSTEILRSIEYLNHAFLRQCPGKKLHAIKPQRDFRSHSDNEPERREAAYEDFVRILLHEKSDAMVLRMLSKFAECQIPGHVYEQAEKAVDEKERAKLIDQAFKNFDYLANCLNHIFEQFAVNQLVTRNGFVPRQDEKITSEVYEPTLRALSDPKWRGVSDDLAKMFQDYREQDYPEAITKAHAAVQRFLQILVGEEGKNGKGEVGALFNKAKAAGLVPTTRFSEPLVNGLQGFIVSERATNSTAKPTLKDTTAADALLMINGVMVFLQHCLQASK